MKVDVLTGRNDDARTGANLQEMVLNPQLLQRGRFGKLFSYDVDGFIYAQPLVATEVKTQYGSRNILIVATTKNKLYAFDADHTTPDLIWRKDLTASGSLVETKTLSHLAPSVGILSTPVIDKTTNTIYAVSRSYQNPKHHQILSKLALDSGALKSSVEINGTIQVNGTSFDPEVQINRPGLALANGLVVIMWGTFLDGEKQGDERGWVTAFDKETLALKGVFCTTCYATTGAGGMLWQAGRPPAIEAGRYVYFFSGNGWLNRLDKGRKDNKEDSYIHSCDPSRAPAKPVGQFSESLIKLDTLEVGRWKDNQGFATWTPYDWCELDQNDTDFGGSGPMLIAGANQTGGAIAVGGGKAGVLYAIDTSKITRAELVEWMAVSPVITHLNRIEAINECVDFEEGGPPWAAVAPFTKLASPTKPPPLLGTTIDVPAKFTHPWAVTVGALGGGEHGSTASGIVRPLCAPLDPTPVNYGTKHDHVLHHIMGGTVFIPTSNDGKSGRLFVAPEGLPVLGFGVQNSRITSGPMISQIDTKRFPFIVSFITSRHPGGILALSASGNSLDTGIVWVSHFHDPEKGPDATFEIHEGVLEAFDAANLNLLWSSEGKPDDRLGYFQKFTPPTVANGKVYLAASPSPGSIRGCNKEPAKDQDPDPCLVYDQAGSDGHIVVYGEIPRFRPWQVTTSGHRK